MEDTISSLSSTFSAPPLLDLVDTDWNLRSFLANRDFTEATIAWIGFHRESLDQEVKVRTIAKRAATIAESAAVMYTFFISLLVIPSIAELLPLEITSDGAHDSYEQYPRTCKDKNHRHHTLQLVQYIDKPQHTSEVCSADEIFQETNTKYCDLHGKRAVLISPVHLDQSSERHTPVNEAKQQHRCIYETPSEPRASPYLLKPFKGQE
ncbi:hypothetical protein JG687_00011475 [Phytophthora cactorum]|uniref:Uncharacterized protein n=1 Tax=Phytophthora cactorum TaxID=29920 RepID=A0A8T1U4H7_9STRA|nr:hypothetical protein JG687_00011475 [Phytophthora cactorum]